MYKNKKVKKINSIDDHFEMFYEEFGVWKKIKKKARIGAGVGVVLGVVGGVVLGENINDYVEVLKESPVTIQYTVDACSGVLLGVVGGVGGALLNAIPEIYNYYKKSYKF